MQRRAPGGTPGSVSAPEAGPLGSPAPAYSRGQPGSTLRRVGELSTELISAPERPRGPPGAPCAPGRTGTHGPDPKWAVLGSNHCAPGPTRVPLEVRGADPHTRDGRTAIATGEARGEAGCARDPVRAWVPRCPEERRSGRSRLGAAPGPAGDRARRIGASGAGDPGPDAQERGIEAPRTRDPGAQGRWAASSGAPRP